MTNGFQHRGRDHLSSTRRLYDVVSKPTGWASTGSIITTAIVECVGILFTSDLRLLQLCLQQYNTISICICFSSQRASFLLPNQNLLTAKPLLHTIFPQPALHNCQQVYPSVRLSIHETETVTSSRQDN